MRSSLGLFRFHGRYYIGFLIFCQEIFSLEMEIKYFLVSEKPLLSTKSYTLGKIKLVLCQKV